MFELKKITILEKADARKQGLGREDAWNIIRSVEKVRVGKGKKIIEFIPGSDRKEDILAFFADHPLIAHNARFDYGFLREEFLRLDPLV